jgi:Uma2 family endonuclease
MTLTVDALDITYPDSDGKPMSDNTKQFEWISIIKWCLDSLLKNDFVAGDLLWYPVQGKPRLRQAPDILVALGRPKGHRGSYKQWEEENIAPQIAFEILSPGNRPDEMQAKLEFYEKYGIEEYYLYDPETFHFSGWIRDGAHLRLIDPIDGWISPRLKIRFEAPGDIEMAIYHPDNTPFKSPLQLHQELEQLRATLKELENKK